MTRRTQQLPRTRRSCSVPGTLPLRWPGIIGLVTQVQGDLRDPRSLDVLVDVLVQLAATLTLDAETDFRRGLETNLLSLVELLGRCRLQPSAPLLLFTSSISTPAHGLQPPRLHRRPGPALAGCSDASGPGQRPCLGPDRLAHPRALARPANHVPAGPGHSRCGRLRRRRGAQLLASRQFAQAIVAWRVHHELARLDCHADAALVDWHPDAGLQRIVGSWSRVFTWQRCLESSPVSQPSQRLT